MIRTDVAFTIDGTLSDTRSLLDRAADLLDQEIGSEGAARLATELRDATLSIPRVRFPSDGTPLEERATRAMEQQADAATLSALVAYRDHLATELSDTAARAIAASAIRTLGRRLAIRASASDAATEGT